MQGEPGAYDCGWGHPDIPEYERNDGDVSASLRAFLDYVDGRLSDDSFVQELEEAVDEAKKNGNGGMNI